MYLFTCFLQEIHSQNTPLRKHQVVSNAPSRPVREKEKAAGKQTPAQPPSTEPAGRRFLVLHRPGARSTRVLETGLEVRNAALV